MGSDSVSVIIPVRNGAEFIGDAVKSALGQTHAPGEIFVIDDGSTDDLRGAMEKFRGHIALLSQPPRGVSAARNAGLAAAGGEWIAFLDADDAWYPPKLARQLETVAGKREIALVYSDMEVVGEASRSRWLSRHHPQRGRVFRYLLADNFIWTSSVIARREAILAVGGFDEALTHVEDRDLWLRLAAQWEVEFVAEALGRLRRRADSAMQRREQALTCMIEVLTRAEGYAPEEYRAAWPEVRPRLAEASFEVGRLCLEKGDRAAARAWFARSLRYPERRLRGLAYWAAAFLPRRAEAALRRSKRALGKLA